MKILLYSKHQKLVEKSGVGRALEHQKRALDSAGVTYTLDENDDYDIVHLNTIFPGSLRMAKKAKAQGRKVVYHAHSTCEDFRNSFIGSNMAAPLFKKWITHCYNQGDVILTPTPYSKQLLENYDINHKITAISNGIDLREFKRDNEAGMHFRNRYGFTSADKVIMSVGLQIERKGILDFVEIAGQMPEYKFFWCGYSDPRTIPKKIRDAVKTDLPNLFFPGYVSKDEMKGVYSGSDLFLFMTHEETEGIVLLEALSMKTPVLVRDIPIYSYWLKDGVHVYKDNANKGFKEKIKNILSGTLPDLTEKAYEVPCARDIESIGMKLRDIYETVL